jgi:hypothetical protein
MVDICSGLVYGVRRAESEGDCWKWSEESYTVKETYHLLIERERRMSSVNGSEMFGTI